MNFAVCGGELRDFDGEVVRLREFMSRAGASLRSFRYYESRPWRESLRDHLVTIFGYPEVHKGNPPPIAYGHIDFEPNGVTTTYWLGICVAEEHTGKGHGREMMSALLCYADEAEVSELTLAVDNDNHAARALYYRSGFVNAATNGAGVLFMKRKRGGKVVADTLGSLVDKLATVNQKMFVNQELLYEIRRMDFEAFKAKYLGSDEGGKQLWETLKKACDLNVQRSALVQEVDEKVVEIARAAAAGKELDDGQHIQRQHKTY